MHTRTKLFSIKPFIESEEYGGWRLTYDVGGYHTEEQVTRNTVSINIASRWVIRITLPPFIKAIEKKVYPRTPYSEETIQRLGRDYYIEYFGRSYGFAFTKDHLSISYGKLDMQRTDKRKIFNYDWKDYTYRKEEYIDLNGKVINEFPDCAGYELLKQAKQTVDKAYFLFKDYDGEEILATTYIIRRTWSAGRGAFEWLRWFRKDLVRTTLDLSFNKEVGVEKGSWKGGVMGTCYDVPEDLPLEAGIHEKVFKLYCEKEHRGKSGKYKLEFISAISEEEAVKILNKPKEKVKE